nr:hypothetical protein [uncultured Pedobacter sp.]
MKKLIIILLVLLGQQGFSQINSPNGNNIFYYNGAADVTFRYADRGNGGRAFVHADGNVLGLNYGNDFTGGVTIGNNFMVGTNGSFRSNFWQPWNSTQNDFYVDVEPGSRILRTRNWNTEYPNIAATGIHTGTGYFESYVGVGTTAPDAPLTVYGMAKFYPARVGSGDTRALSVSNTLSNHSFVSNDYPVILTTGGGNQPMILDAARIGIGTATPAEKLSVNGNIRAKEIKVEAANWPDYVFDKDYRILGLQELDAYIKANKHLPGMPSAKEVEANGMALGEMVKLQQKKIEELTLHLIEKDNEILKLKNLEGKFLELEMKLNKLINKN